MSDADRIAGNIASVLSRVAESGVFRNFSYTAQGPVKEILRKCDPDSAELCEHLSALRVPPAYRSQPLPEVALWSAWSPDLIVCHDCRGRLIIPDNTANHRCDYCGKLSMLMLSGASVIEPETEGSPVLVCTYGLCPGCGKQSGMSEEGYLS